MVNIETSFAAVQSYEQLCEIAEKAEPKLSFWGMDYVTVEGYEGTLGLDDLTWRVLALVERNYEFDEKERDIGQKIVNRINYIYDASETLYKTSSLFTKILFFLRHTEIGVTAVMEWTLFGKSRVFTYYTKSQLENVFGHNPKKMQEKGGELVRVSEYPERWCVITSPPPRGFFSSWVTS